MFIVNYFLTFPQIFQKLEKHQKWKIVKSIYHSTGLLRRNLIALLQPLRVLKIIQKLLQGIGRECC